MMVRCSVLHCKSDSERKLPNLSFHSFPTDENILPRWISATGRTNWTPKQSSRICSEHFNKNDLIKKKRVTVLFPNSVPLISPQVQEPIKIDVNATQSRSKSSRLGLVLEPEAIVTAENVNVLKNIDLNVIASTSKFIKPEAKVTAESVNVLENTDINVIASTSKVVEPEATVSAKNVNVLKNIDINVFASTSKGTSPRRLEKKLNRSIKQSAERLKKLRALREKCRRLTKKVANLQDVIAELKAKSLVSEEDGVLLESIETSNKDFLKKILCPATCGRKYSPALRKFALCLNFISPRAYRYVREQFNTCLPHPSTLTSWYKSVDANPGFTTEALNCIKLISKNKNKQLYCALSMDEMAIRKHVHWDGEKCVGLVNYGDALDSDSAALAREALVFMVTSINDGWKIPVGYFFIDGCNGVQKANLVKQCIETLIDCDINVVSLTFDGCPANFIMANKLGCSFDSSENITPFFKVNDQKILIVPDPAHMLKLVRNTLGQKKVLTNENGEQIEWRYIEELHVLQENEGLHLANSLKHYHVNFKQQIMKVKLAAQVFSNSVADAIEFCDKELNLQSFSGSHATVEFIRRINDIFDILNSRNLRAYGFKKPISLENGDQIINYLNETERYIKNLSLDGINILHAGRKVGFRGFLICIKTLKEIYSDYILTGKLKFLPFYKLSQDHLEYFFSSIRSKGGNNNNPTAFQFQTAYKKLVVHGEVKSITSGNCIPLEELKILTHTEARYEAKLNAYTEGARGPDSPDILDVNLNLETSDHDYLPDPSRLTLYTEDIIPYIGGYVVKKLRKSLKCQECLLALVSENYPGLIFKKDKGGLTYPSTDVIKICQVAEKVFKLFNNEQSFFAKKNLMLKLINCAFKNCQLFFNGDHFNNQPLIGNHQNLLTKAILARYFEIRIHHATKKFEPKEKN